MIMSKRYIAVANREVKALVTDYGVQPLTTLFDCEIILAFTARRA